MYWDMQILQIHVEIFFTIFLFHFFFFSASCPMCNTPGFALGRAYINIDEEDVQAYVQAHPETIQSILQAQQGIGNINDNGGGNGDNVDDGIDSDDSEDAVLRRIPRLNLNMRVNAGGILFTPMQLEDEYTSSDDNMSDGSDIMHMPDTRIRMRVNATRIEMSLMPSDDSDEDN